MSFHLLLRIDLLLSQSVIANFYLLPPSAGSSSEFDGHQLDLFVFQDMFKIDKISSTLMDLTRNLFLLKIVMEFLNVNTNSCLPKLLIIDLFHLSPLWLPSIYTRPWTFPPLQNLAPCVLWIWFWIQIKISYLCY